MRTLQIFLGLIFALASNAQDRPNILWLTVEDISPMLSMYGDSTAHTPHLDRLASESLIFNEAYAPVAVCAPARSSIITGMYPTSIGTQHMRTGKDIMGWGKREYDGESNAKDINVDVIPHYSAVIPPAVKCFTEYLRKAGYYCTNNAKTDYQFAAPVTAWDENGNQAHWRGRGEGQPFFSVFNFGITHESQVWKNADKPHSVNPKTVPLPPYFPSTDVVRNDVARVYSNIELLDQQIGERLEQLQEDGLLDHTVIFFFSDHGGPLPRGKRAHYRSGLKVPFMARLPGEAAQQFVNDMISFVDLAPTMLSLAGVEIPAYMQGRAFLGCQRSGQKREFIFGSGDRFDEHTDRIRTVISKEYLYVKNYHPGLPAYKDISYRLNVPMMREWLARYHTGELSEEQSYWFRSSKTSEEFYIRSEDPYSLDNRINTPGYQHEIQKMRNALADWQAKVGDKGGIPEKELFLSMWPGGKQPQAIKPTVHRLDEKYELRTVTEGASIAYLISKETYMPGLDAGWQLYFAPISLQEGDILYAMTTRIGFKDSELLIYK